MTKAAQILLVEDNRMDAELARLFEDYYQQAFSQTLAVKPQYHRIVPVGQSIRSTMEVRPYETAADLVNAAPGMALSSLGTAFNPGEDKFRALFPQIDWTHQLAYAEKLGLGNRAYTLVKLEDASHG